MMPASTWALALVFWLHMAATVVWIGGLAALSIFVMPAAGRMLEAGAYAGFLAELQRRLNPVGWFCLAVLAGTGMIQMSANPHYQGFLVIETGWAGAILVKHLVFLSMAGLSAYQAWGLAPRLERNALRRAYEMRQAAPAGDEIRPAAVEAEKLLGEQSQLIRLNLALGIIALGLTALARAA